MKKKKICKYCGKKFTRRKYAHSREGSTTFKNRKFCSHLCANAYRSKGKEPIICPNCKGPVYRKTYSNGKKESFKRLNNRKFCSIKCRRIYNGSEQIPYETEYLTTDRLCRVCNNPIIEEWCDGVCVWTAWYHCRDRNCIVKWNKVGSWMVE